MAPVNRATSRRAASAPVPSARWHDWLEQHVPTSAQALVSPARRLVVLAPHPDDEVLACALLMQQHAAAGGALHLVAATDGEASHLQAPWTVQHTQAIRCSERSAGLAALGLQHVPVTPLHLPDGGVAQAGGRLHAALLDLLAPGDALVTTWRQDGHPDHDGCGRVALDLARGLRIPVLQAPVWLWHWAQPGAPGIPWHALRALAAPPAALRRKAVALQAHRSQLAPRSAQLGPVLDAAAVERAHWPREYFFCPDPD